ncbi:hypothetical protein Tco_0316435 [Tanacetum coccineum]
MAEPVLEENITVTRKNYILRNDGGKIVKKSFLELKGMNLIKIRNNDFSGTNGEDAIEHIENFLKVVGPLKIPNVSDDRFRISVFPISLTGAASDWFKEECIGSITSWEDLAKKFFGKFYPPSRTNKDMKDDEDEVSWDQTDNEMESNKEVTNDNEPCRDKGEDYEEENKIAEIFRIETKIFDYESPIYEWNDKAPWVNEKPWKLDGVWKEPTAVKHHCKPFCFKSRHFEWPTSNWRDEEYSNWGNLPGQFQVDNTIHYQDYEWYEALEDSDLKDEALRNKAALEESMNQDEESIDDA